MNQNQQRRSRAAKPYYNAAKMYKTPTTSDTGKRLNMTSGNYSTVRELNKRYQDQDQETEATQAQQDNAHQQKSYNSTQEYMSYKNKLGKAMRQIY